MNIAAILAGIARQSALVVGDVCLDRWCRYDPALAEPSRETGIPRIAVTEVECTPGGGGTVASNLRALGARVAVLGVIGEDGHGHELRRALEERGIDGSALVAAKGAPTFTYTKLINARNGVEDMPRVDYVNARDFAASVEEELVERFRRLAPQADVVLVSDQAETERGGVVSASVRQAIGEFASAHPQKIVWVDSRMRGELFRGVLVKLNEQEAQEACAKLGTGLQGLRRHIGYKTLVLTRGGEGCVVVTESGETVVPIVKVEHPVDICGAGDSFNAGAALTLSITGDPVAAARFGSIVASITIMKPGTGTASPDEVRARAAQNSIL